MAAYLPALQISLRAALSAGLAVLAAQALALPSPLYAMIAAVIVTDLSPAKSRKQALPRMVGTVAGGLLGAVLAYLAPHNALVIGLGVFASMLACHLAKKPESAKLTGYVCGVVLLTHGDSPWAYAAERVVETALGVAIAVAVSLVPKVLQEETPPGP